MRRRKLTLFPIAIALAIGLYQYFGAEKVTNPETGRSARVALSSEQEEALGLQSYREVISRSETVRSGPEQQLVERVAQRLAAATGAAGSGFNWQVTLVRSPQANAFCLPGGKIVVYTGILPLTQSEDGLAAVMGHEMAHAIARHGSQRLLRTSVAQTVMMGAQFSLSDLEPQQRYAVMAALGAGAQYGVLLPFSRDHETEADEMGLIYMIRAGYNPEEAIAFWERMQTAGGGGGGRQPAEFASTHPSHETRIQHLRAFLPKAKAAAQNPGGPEVER
ncbi:MAG TPA: M48 family metallopeptidase [Opitutaceae bacterium]|nr:M48 family metallopeptidase [Opitutaceae bacterium]